MSIRTKLALVLGACAAAAVIAMGALFAHRQTADIIRAESENRALLLASIRRMASESMLAKDPLMLLDYLAFLKRERPEIHHCRVRMEGRWQDLGGKRPASEPPDVIAQTLDFSDASRRSDFIVELHLSEKVIQERQRLERRELLTDLASSAAVVVISALVASFLLARTMTRRLVEVGKALVAIGEGGFGRLIDARGSDEIAGLARGVNSMSERLVELENMKKTFVASVTHELRSPLGAIESHVSHLLSDEPSLGAEARAALDLVRKNARRLSHFVTNLLEMSRIERGKLDFLPRTADIGMLINDSVEFFKPRAAEAGLALERAAPQALPSIVLDPDLVSQVVANLISNAIKFTRRGGWIRVGARVVEGPRAMLECSVEDNGVGIPADALGRLFKPFERIHNPLRAGGAGLGLAISKKIVEMHGGSLGVSSQPGVGSRFYFTLPLSIRASAPRAPGAA